VFDDELLRHILKVSFAHLPESVADILLYKLLFFFLCAKQWEGSLFRVACIKRKCGSAVVDICFESAAG